MMTWSSGRVMAKVWLCAGSIVLACGADAAPPSDALVDQYLELAKMKEVVDANLEGYRTQFLESTPASMRKSMSRYLDDTMSWTVMQNDYRKVVRANYSSEDLKSAISYLRTPAGTRFASRTITLQRELSLLNAQRAQRKAMGAQDTSADSDSETVQSSDDLRIDNVERHEVAERVYFTGSIENVGKRAARWVEVEVNLFKDGKFVDQYSTHISGSIKPGTSRLFKISCGCKDSPPAEHDGYKFNVIARDD